MRRILAFFLAAVVLAAGWGFHARSSAVLVNGQVISYPEIEAEFAAIAHKPLLQCYLGALAQNGFTSAAGADSTTTAAVASWVSLRVEGLAIGNYVRQHYHHVVSAKELESAKAALEGELTVLARQYSLTCPGTPAQAVAMMTPALRTAEVAGEANSLYLLSKLKTTTPLTVSALKRYYKAHQSSYTAICISVALVPAAKIPAFQAGIRAGQSVAALAKKFSSDPSATKGGSYGCYGPSSSAYAAVTADLKGVRLHHFSKGFPYQSGSYGLYIAPDRIIRQSFAQSASAVLTAIKAANAKGANAVSQQLLYYAHVMIGDSLGLWSLLSTGPRVSPVRVPASNDVPSLSLFQSTTAPSYQ